MKHVVFTAKTDRQEWGKVVNLSRQSNKRPQKLPGQRETGSLAATGCHWQRLLWHWSHTPSSLQHKYQDTAIMLTGRHQFPEDDLRQPHFRLGITHWYGHASSRESLQRFLLTHIQVLTWGRMLILYVQTMLKWVKRTLGFSLLLFQHEALPCFLCDSLLAFQINSLPLSVTGINLPSQSLIRNKGKQWHVLGFQVLSVSWIQTLKFTGQTSASPPQGHVQLSEAWLENKGFCKVQK